MQGWLVIATAVVYIACLFAVASYGDEMAKRGRWRGGRPVIYAMSLCVYCTSWTFFGSVGLAASSGFDFLTVYIGAAAMISLGYPLVLRIVRIAKAQNITSIGDFIASRYGKSQAVAAGVTLITVVGALPYIALQLKAISASMGTMVGYLADSGAVQTTPILADTALFVALSLAAFAILFGTRHIDATEHQDGMMLAIATESVVKLGAFLLVGVFVTFVMFDGPADMWRQADAAGDILPRFFNEVHGGTWVTITFLSFVCIILLPRQFHVTVVENNSENEVRTAAWMFPLYLVLINLFVVPIAIAGLIVFEPGTIDADMFVLALPMAADARWVTLAAFIGGLSAATAMVIVASVALSIMICNDLVMPLLLRRGAAGEQRQDMGRTLLLVRRTAIFAILLMAYAYYRSAGNTAALASIGLLSFAAIAQLAPAFFGGLLWRHGTARGAIAGTAGGFSVWFYTLLLPTFASSGLLPTTFVESGPFGLNALRPQQLFYLEFSPLTHGVFWSMLINVSLYVAVSMMRRPTPIERLQANVFVQSDLTPSTPVRRLWRSSVTLGELMDAVARYMGEERTQRAFETMAAERDMTLDRHAEVDLSIMRSAEHLLASAIGAASSRVVLSLLLKRRDVSPKQALKLLDDASEAIGYNRELLQTAIDHVREGIAVFDADLRLTCWNRQFRELLDLPAEFGQVGVSLSALVRFCAERGDFGPGTVDSRIEEHLRRLVVCLETFHERLSSGRVMEFRTSRMPDDGFVTTYTDITDRVRAAEELSRANETLERRVRERTEELTHLNHALEHAKAQADEANVGKTRFLAAASHDILQPLNAARLYAASLAQQRMGQEQRRLAGNIDASLDAVEEILGVILDISRLDTGALKPELSSFALGDLLRQLEVEFAPSARDKGLDLRMVPSSLAVRSDRRLLRRVLQNLVSNAVKYTVRGRVLVGVRRAGGLVRVEVHDTGTGIPASKQHLVFKEFHRLAEGAQQARGLGLGLSIVERIGRVLDHPLHVASQPGRGSTFAIAVPVAERLAAAVPVRAVRRPAAAARIDGLRVLCIDNERQILEGMASLMRGWGCEAICALSCEEAEAVAGSRGVTPDLLIVDYHLDDGNGIAAARRLRTRFGADMPAVLITADRSPQVRAEARAGDMPLLYKPLKAAALRAVMAQWRARGEAAE